MMDKFTASNGAQIVLTNARQTGYVLVEKDDDVASAYLGFEEMVAWREFFRAERDDELGRWRPKGRRDVWALADSDDPNRVLVVSDKLSTFATWTRDGIHQTSDNGVWAGAIARDYFDAHPERKPWHDAKEGEVWIVTPSKALTLGEKAEYPAIFQAGMFRDHGGSWGTEDLTAARRIWPESS